MIEDLIKEALKQFQGCKLTGQVLEMIRHSIQNTGFVDKVEGPEWDKDGIYFLCTLNSVNTLLTVRIS